MSQNKKGQKEILSKVMRYIKRYTGLILLSIVLASLIVILTLYVPILIGEAIDGIVYGQVNFTFILRYLVIISVMVGITALAQWMMNKINNKVTYNVVRDMREAAFKKIEILPLKYLDRRSQGEIVSNSYNFMCYTYINMQTKQSQDYLNFSDTAQPVSNFFVDYHSFGNGNLLAEKRDSDWKGNISWLPDTVENNIRYKRLHMINKYKDGPAEFIYYLDCKSPKTVFHLSRAVDEKYPQCQAVKFINWSHTSFVNSGKPLIWVHEINLVNKKLSQKEIKIFKQWKRNSQLTKLPIISNESATKAAFQRMP